VTQKLEVAIIGAGVAGLASAILLSRQGHRVTIYERFEASRPLGSGLMMQPTGLAALERLGLRSDLESLGHRIERLYGQTTKGSVIFDLAYADLTPGLHAVAVHRASLHGVLWRGFESTDAMLETGCEITGMDFQAGGKTAPIDAKGRRRSAADLVVDASGARSPLRALVAGHGPRPFTYGAVWATVPDIGIAPGMLAQRYVAARIMIGYLPLGRITASEPPCAALFWSLKPGAYEAWRGGFEPWREEAAEVWPEMQPVLTALSGADQFTPARYAHFTTPHVAHGNLILIGDASHMTSPQLGQGANQGLIDAVVLSDALAASADIPTALQLFARHRRRHVGFYQMASAVMTPFFQSDSRLLAILRDLTFDRMKIVPYLRREMVRTLAGLKTGVFSAASPEQIVNCLAGFRV
jgi:2-polyprenyl-6-methoxyphenol hydroxylase-like FAD-dependent oxidoreductase